MTPPRRPPPPRIRLEIGRLVLHDVPLASRRRFEAAFAEAAQTALAGLDPAGPRAAAALRTGTLRLPGSDPEALGRALAAAIVDAVAGVRR